MYIFALFIISFIVPILCAAESDLVKKINPTQISEIPGYNDIMKQKLDKLKNTDPEQYNKLIEYLKKQSPENQAESKNKKSTSAKSEENN